MMIYPDHYNPLRIICYIAFIPVCLLINALLQSLGVFNFHCPKCRGVCVKRDELRQAAAPDRDGVGVKITECPKCGWRREREYRIIRPISAHESADPRYVPGGLMRRYIVGSNLPGFSDPAGEEGAKVLQGRVAGAIMICVGLIALAICWFTTRGWVLLLALSVIAAGVITIANNAEPVSTDDSPWQNWRPWWNPWARSGDRASDQRRDWDDRQPPRR
jgi:Zn-finger nucleic acid-binding protein